MIRRSEKYKQFGGVCAGYAISQGHSVALVRILTMLLFTASGGIVGLLYITAWIILPSASTGPADWDRISVHEPVRRSNNRIFGGVCGAIAQYLDADASIIRVTTIVFAMIAGSGIWTYFYAWMILPQEK